ncbi:flagellar basal body rod protein FlgB [Tepidamorphus sp. 3E244]|uniref:flagellar basal body rod protein FlgB n=1 Tax=Tepidamorphus sp. 3E244 TaxID=3385498 RepID=UPI0038FCF986
MSFFDLPILSALKTKIRYHNERQVLLAQNVANAETPGYGARDLKAPDFSRMLQPPTATSAGSAGGSPIPGAPMGPVRTQSMHLAGLSLSMDFKATSRDSFETTPEGNAVVLEDEMMKIAQNQIDHQIVSSIYTRGISIMKRAVGRSA